MKQRLIDMKRAFDFVLSLDNSFFDDFGYPSFRFESDRTEVYFDSENVVRDLSVLKLESDEFRMFPSAIGCLDGHAKICYVFVFYNLPFDE